MVFWDVSLVKETFLSICSTRTIGVLACILLPRLTQLLLILPLDIVLDHFLCTRTTVGGTGNYEYTYCTLTVVRNTLEHVLNRS